MGKVEKLLEMLSEIVSERRITESKLTEANKDRTDEGLVLKKALRKKVRNLKTEGYLLAAGLKNLGVLDTEIAQAVSPKSKGQ